MYFEFPCFFLLLQCQQSLSPEDSLRRNHGVLAEKFADFGHSKF